MSWKEGLLILAIVVVGAYIANLIPDAITTPATT